MKTFHHFGLLAPAEMPGETYYESLKVWATDPQQDPNRIEWLRFAPDSPWADTPLAQMPHISFAVDDLEHALGGRTPIVGPLEVARGVRIAYLLVDGALTEDLEVK
jgi:hypothetical protein